MTHARHATATHTNTQLHQVSHATPPETSPRPRVVFLSQEIARMNARDQLSRTRITKSEQKDQEAILAALAVDVVVNAEGGNKRATIQELTSSANQHIVVLAGEVCCVLERGGVELVKLCLPQPQPQPRPNTHRSRTCALLVLHPLVETVHPGVLTQGASHGTAVHETECAYSCVETWVHTPHC